MNTAAAATTTKIAPEPWAIYFSAGPKLVQVGNGLFKFRGYIREKPVMSGSDNHVPISPHTLCPVSPALPVFILHALYLFIMEIMCAYNRSAAHTHTQSGVHIIV